jgi:dTDP-4-dehydrorhamnose 3,5-epimerase
MVGKGVESMKIVDVSRLAFPEVAVIRFARFKDHRGYFTEHYRESDFQGLEHLRGIDFRQMNESFSKAGTIRGLHFQWNPFQGKLVRAVAGRLIDLVMDIRKGSPTFGRIIAADLPANRDADQTGWIWVPPGFAHGMLLVEDTLVEYLCSGEYNPKCEAGISPFSDDLDWSLCDPELRAIYDEVAATTELVSPKDRDAPCLSEWADDFRSAHFTYDRSYPGGVRPLDPPNIKVA